MSDAPRVVVLGAGRMGRRHMQVVRDLGLSLVGIADLSPDAAASAGQEFGVASDACAADAHALLAASRPEGVVVSTTAPSHAEYVQAAVDAGARWILCEKPMGVSLAECDAMLARCRAAGVRLAVNHQMRYMAQYTEARRITESEAFGGLRSVTVVAGNFGLAMNGSHYFEMFRYVTGEAPARVAAWFSPDAVPNPRGPQYEDRAGTIRAVTNGGHRFHMEIGGDQGHGMHVIYAGRYGQLFVDELAGFARLVVREAEHRALPTTRYGMPYRTETFTLEPADAFQPTKAVLDALLRDADYPTGEDGRLAVNALVAAYHSDAHGHAEVALDDPALDRTRTFPWA